jgi:hypothetical protein
MKRFGRTNLLVILVGGALIAMSLVAVATSINNR